MYVFIVLKLLYMTPVFRMCGCARQKLLETTESIRHFAREHRAKKTCRDSRKSHAIAGKREYIARIYATQCNTCTIMLFFEST